MKLHLLLSFALAAGCAADAPVPSTSSAPITNLPPLKPHGVYAHFEISHAIADGWSPDCTQQKSLCKLYRELLATPGVSGLALGVHWDDVQGFPPAIDMSNVDHAFDAALDAGLGQTIILGLSPGIHTPDWLFTGAYGQMVLKPITSCDGWFLSGDGTTDSNCGSVTFERYPEQNGTTPARFPVPWDSRYLERYLWFAQDVAGYYSASGPHPQYAQVLAAVAISGPTGASPELILPANTKTVEPGINGPGYPTAGWYDWDVSGAHGIWNMLLANQLSTTAQQTAFVDPWNHMIDHYATSFSGVTLILTPDTGQALPVYTVTSSEFADDVCKDPKLGGKDNPSCTAVASIMQHLFAVSPITNDALALMTGGMTASSAIVLYDGQAATISGSTGTIGVPGIKYALANATAQVPLVGGAEFDHSLTDDSICNKDTGQTCLQVMGCVSDKFCSVTKPQAMYNVLSVFFYRTKGAADFNEPTVQPNPAPSPLPPITHMSYVYVDYTDIRYAGSSRDVPTMIDAGCVTVQYMLSLASYHLVGGTLPPPPTCS